MSDNVWQASTKFPDQHVVITPSDTVDFHRPLLVVAGSGGNISVVDKTGVAITYTMLAGQTVPVIAKRVNATGTTVTPLIGLFT